MNEKAKTESYEVRQQDIERNKEVWLSSPLFGNGFGANSVGTSNSLFALLADGGVFLFLFYGYSLLWLPLKCYFHKEIRGFSYSYALVFGVFLITVTAYTNIILFLIAYPWAARLKRRNLVISVSQGMQLANNKKL